MLLASSNPMKMVRNLPHILNEEQLALISVAISHEAALLFKLGQSHLTFAGGIPESEWRQRTSRLYYAAYNCRRAVVLKLDGSFSTDASDHQSVDKLPATLSDYATYYKKLKDLREDRNLADYSHLARVGDLLIPIGQSLHLVEDFFAVARSYLESQGVVL